MLIPLETPPLSNAKRLPNAFVAKTQCRFATENEFDEVELVYVSDSEGRCVTPRRRTPSTAQVTVSNDGRQFSGWPLVYTKGSGTFLKFLFDNSQPGCFDCVNSQFPGSADGRGLNPAQITELWTIDNKTGPYVGGTEVTVTAKGLDWAKADVAHPYDLSVPGFGLRYNGPVGGPGAPHPHNVDPTSHGNGPPVTGTFYPHLNLRCQWQCFFDRDQNIWSGKNYTVDGALVRGVENVTYSDWVPAKWRDYTEVTCESPPHEVPAAANEPIAPTTCVIRVSNDEGASYHNDSYALWRYEDRAPTVTRISTNQRSAWPARGPFAGNTEVRVIGTNFLPSKYLKCKFGGVSAAEGSGAYVERDDVSHVVGELGGRARYISSTEIACVTPPFGPAASRAQYPSGSPGAVGSGAILDVSGFVTNAEPNDAVGGVAIVSGGRGYATPPTISFEGGGGTGARANCTIDQYGAIATVTVTDGGRGYNRGAGAAATAALTTASASAGKQTVSAVDVTDGGSGYLTPPEVFFRCAGGAEDRSCFAVGDVSDGAPSSAISPGVHARAVAVLGEDPSCDRSFERCRGRGAVVRVDVLFAGAFYASAPVVAFAPRKPYARVTANEWRDGNATRGDPSAVGGYSKQGKGADELDPERAHGSWPSGALSVAVPYDVEYARYPDGGESFYGVPGLVNGRAPGVDDGPCVKSADECPDPANGDTKASGWKTCVLCPEMRNPEDRGPLLPPLGEAFMDGSIKPGHQELVRVSNNYHKFGVVPPSDRDAPRTHVGYRDQTKDPSIGQDMGYWIWSTSGTTAEEMNKCRVSNNPPAREFAGLQGHGLDAAFGFGAASDGGGGLLRLDGSSVGGAPGSGATAHAELSGNATQCATTLGCYVSAIVVDNPGEGYNKPPVVIVSGGGAGHGARAVAVLSGGTVFRVDVDPNNRGMSYTSTPTVTLVAATEALAYDAGSGHGAYGFDQSTLGLGGSPSLATRYRGTSNYDVGHGAFPGHPGNTNLGHPDADCVYFMYSDIYVSPSGSDSTGQGTAGRPYRTIQKCIDASLAGARDYYVYKKADGGDRDPAVPDGSARFGVETAGERVDATGEGMNTPTGYDAGYTGRAVRHVANRATGWRRPKTGALYGGASWSDDSRDAQKGFGYAVNRDRCVLKDGTYWGEGNRELQPHGHMVEVWAENAQEVTLDCGGKSVGRNVFAGDRHGGEDVLATGSVSIKGVVMRRCTVRADPAPNYRPYYPGRPGYGPGARDPAGTACWPGATGCQFQQQ